ncbi:DUF5057 domain-containing protein [Exiguobacterium sp.]|uniref:DUF5057 domain-containing protein n=1 Tax=Exiguobacterium sp. TaxID=44751 RepID=UPI0028A6281C|nr:DUF5057 domain-containing protein [Exiguobacterium sp.]
MKQWIRLALATLLIFSSFTYIQEPHSKAATGEKFKILEIRDEWSTTNRIDPGTKITSLLTGLDSARFDVKKMTVKELNASRFPLDGAFDAIVFDPSINSNDQEKYSIKLSEFDKRNHNTSKIENDITRLKSNEILNAYVRKGLPVYLHKDVFTHDQSNFSKVLKNYVSTQATVSYENINDVINSLKQKINVRPRISNVTVKQAGNTLSSIGSIAVPNRPIEFSYTLDQSITDTTATLYIDFDSNDQFDESEKVDELPAAANGKLTYTFDVPSYTGPRQWMIRINKSNGLSDYKTGSFLMKDQLAEAKVLQVLGTRGIGSLLDNLKGENLSKNDFYNFNLNVIDSAKFSSEVTSKDLNASYDMLIFGFQDSYGTASLTDLAFDKVKSFTNTGQGLMLTHDTIFRSNVKNTPTRWEADYATASGQTYYTNMGFAAPKKSKKAIRQNEGQMTSFPFALDNEISIAQTHNQYFALDLEQPDLIPWYNIKETEANTETGRTVGDARNHYYMYTKGNITYSGAGHTSSFTNVGEQNLFTNTMYRAFIGANHKPLLKNILPLDQTSYLESEPLTISYQINDYDLRDRELKTRIFIDGAKVYENNKIQNNSLVSQTFNQKLLGKSNVTIRVEAEDQRGAKTVETRTVKVVSPSASEPFALTRSINPSMIPRGETAEIKYTINPIMLQQHEAIGNNGQKTESYSVFMEDILFQEKFPDNLEIVSTSGLKNKNISGQNVSGSLDAIEYVEEIPDLHKGMWKPVKDTITFSITVRAKEASGAYILEQTDNSLTSVKNIYKKIANGKREKVTTIANESQAFKPLGYALTSGFATRVSIPPVQMKITTPSYRVLPEINPVGSKHGFMKWSIVDESIATIDNEGVVRPKKVGRTRIKLDLPVANGKILTATSELIIEDEFKELSVNKTFTELFIGETRSFEGKALMYSDQELPVRWIIDPAANTLVNESSRGKLELTGKMPGTVTVKAVVPATAGSSTYLAQSPEYKIEVKLPELSVLPNNLELWVDSKQDVTAKFEPNYPLPFTVSTVSNAIQLNQTSTGYTITGKSGTPSGTVEAILKLTDFPSTVAKTLIRVRENPTSLTAADLMMTMKDDNKLPSLRWLPVTATEQFYRLEVLQGKEYVKVDPTGQALQPLRPGAARIKVTALKENKTVLEVMKDNQSTPLTTTFKVNISSDSNSPENDKDVY